MAQYPSAAGTDANLFVAKNNLSCSLSGAHDASVTTITVSSTTGFPTAGYITIDAEAISYTGVGATTFTGCTRGADSTTAAAHADLAQVKHCVVAAHHNVLKDEIKAVEGDLVAAMAALTPVTAASTAASLLIRLEHIVSQIKNGFGLTNWYDVVTAMLPKSGGTMSGNIAMGTNKLTGLAAGSTNGDSVRYEQVNGVYLPLAGGTMAADIVMGSNKLSGLAAGTAAGHSLRFEQMKIIQVVAGTQVNSASTTSSTAFAATGTTVTITPTSASNKILIVATGCLAISRNDHFTYATLTRAGGNLGGTNGMVSTQTGLGSGSAFSESHPAAMVWLDAPATTSATAYAVYIRVDNASFTGTWGETLSSSAIIVMEVAP